MYIPKLSKICLLIPISIVYFVRIVLIFPVKVYIISSFKPPIFWKDKDIVRKQVNKNDLEKIEDMIFKTNDIELLIKKNSENAINIVSDFIINTSK